MDFKYKYLKYKTKYLSLINNNLNGGNINKVEEQYKDINKQISKFVFDNDALPIYNLDDLPVNLHYRDNNNMANKNCHIGQRKTLLTELEFYNKCVDFDEENNIIIYAGSASCEHLPVLLDLFPTLKFLLIDPNYFSINWKLKYIYQNTDTISKDNLDHFKSHLTTKKQRYEHLAEITKLGLTTNFIYDNEKYDIYDVINNKKYIKQMDKFKNKFFDNETNIIDLICNNDDRVYIIQDYMTIDLTKQIKKYIDKAKTKHKIYFLSDIRTNIHSGTDKSPADLDILWNSALQIIFIKGLEPEFSMLKFRTPFYIEDDPTIQIIKNKDKKYDYILDDIKYVKKEYDIDLIKYYLKKEFLYFKSDFTFIQPWAPESSSETRMFVSKQNLNKDFIPYSTDHEHKMFYLRFIRFFKYYPFFYENIKDIKDLHYDGCQDCCREIMILMDYILKEHSYRYNISKIAFELKNKDNIKQLIEINNLIKKYTFFDLTKTNYKCPQGFGYGHGNKNKFMKFNPFITKDIIYKFDKHSKLIEDKK